MTLKEPQLRVQGWGRGRAVLRTVVHLQFEPATEAAPAQMSHEGTEEKAW